MGAAKHNPTAQAARRGELPPKPRPLGAAAARRLAYAKAVRLLSRRVPAIRELFKED